MYLAVTYMQLHVHVEQLLKPELEYVIIRGIQDSSYLCDLVCADNVTFP